MSHFYVHGCRVNTKNGQGIKQLRVSFGSTSNKGKWIGEHVHLVSNLF